MAIRSTVFTGIALILAAGTALAHGDVAPQPVNTDALPDIGEEWLIENPYRAEAAGEEVWSKALEIGSSGYNQNCARCHGIEAISGGLAPDLRFLEADEFGDEWFVERFRYGYTQNGVTKMPEFGELLGQEAGWAIRTYIEARPDDQVVVDLTPVLRDLRDQLVAIGDAGGSETSEVQGKLADIAAGIETLSGAPVADSIAFEAAMLLESDPASASAAAEILTIGLSAAH